MRQLRHYLQGQLPSDPREMGPDGLLAVYGIWVVKDVGITAEWVYVTLAALSLLSLVYAAATDGCIKATQYILLAVLAVLALLGILYIYGSQGGDRPVVYISVGVILLLVFMCVIAQTCSWTCGNKSDCCGLCLWHVAPVDQNSPSSKQERLAGPAPNENGFYKLLGMA